MRSPPIPASRAKFGESISTKWKWLWFKKNFKDWYKYYGENADIVFNNYGWGEWFMAKKIYVGSSSSKIKKVLLDFDGLEYEFSNVPYNKQNPGWTDSFNVYISNNDNKTLIVERIDSNNGWGQRLVILAYKITKNECYLTR